MAASTKISPDLTPVNFGAFTQTATYSVANQLGFFTKKGLEVTYHQIPVAHVGYDSIQNGAYDVLSGAIDNPIFLRFENNVPLTVVGQLDSGPPGLCIAAVQGINSVADLRGKNFIVDSPSRGYAFMARKVLGLHGLHVDKDYKFVSVGSTVFRYKHLVKGELPDGTPVHASILLYPMTEYLNELDPKTRPRIIAKIPDFIHPLSSAAITVATSTMDPSSPVHDRVVRFTAAMLQANRYLADPTNRERCINALATQLKLSKETAEREYIACTDTETGEIATASGGIFNVNQLGLLNIIALRKEMIGYAVADDFNFADAISPGPGKLIDYSLRDEALKLIE